MSARRRLAAGLGALAVALVAAGPAGAHAYLLETSPPDTAVVPTQPREVRLRFSEPVDFGPHAIQLLDARGNVIATPRATHPGGRTHEAAMRLPPGLADGTYVVGWRIVSVDSHPVSGAFSFSIGSPSAVVSAEVGGSSDAVGFLDAVSRAVAFGGLALAVGGAFLVLVLWPDGPASRRARKLLWTGIGALAGGTILLLLLQGPYATGGSLSNALSPSLLDFSVSTRFGHALLARLALTAALAVFVWLGLRGRRWATLPSGACALGLILTWTLSDHSSTGIQTWLGIPAASIHMGAMALWLGGLAFLLACVLGRGDASLVPVLPRFSRLGLASFAALGVTGAYLTWRQVGTPAALWSTAFGQMLLAKTGIVLTIVALAALSKRAVDRLLPAGLDVGRRLRRTVAGEALLGVAVLGVTAALVNTVPARVSYTPPIDERVAAPAGSVLDGGTVQVKLQSGRPGENVADVFLVDREGHLFPAPEVSGRLIPPGRGVGPLTVPFTQAEPGHYVATSATIPFTGRWTLHLDIRTSDIDETGVDVPLRIR